MSIKVLHVISGLGLGGAQVCVRQLVENSPEDIESFIFPLRCKDSDMQIKGTVLKHDLKNYSLNKFFAIRSICVDKRIDVIHAHLEKPILGALLMSFAGKVKIVVHEHGPIFGRGFKFFLYRLVLKLFHRRVDKFIAVSKATANKLIDETGTDAPQVEVVYNSVDREVFNADKSKRKQVRDGFGIKENDILIGYAGRLSREKGVDILIEAMQQLVKSCPNCMLLIAGEGAQRQELEESIRRIGMNGKVIFAGPVEDIEQVMGALDIGVVPSRREAFGLTALEMMSMRVPVICSSAGGLAELVCHERTGLVCSENDPDAICKSIKRLIEDSELRNKLADAAYIESEKYSVAEYVKKVEHIYRSLIEER